MSSSLGHPSPAAWLLPVLACLAVGPWDPQPRSAAAADAPSTAWRCLPAGEPQPVGWYARLVEEARALDSTRRETVAALVEAAAIHQRQRDLRAFMLKQLGGFPDRVALDPQVVGRIPRDGYRIEKVLFTSRPRHRITANLYLPDGAGPFPGVAVSSGHSRTAKTADYNQRFGIALARAGIAALCYDPIGQGERSQILTTDGTPAHAGTTTEHHLIGTGSILVGRSAAHYRVWDGIRALDYLASRDEIDAERLGMTGCSGGGTLTAYVMAIDDRVACAAPACYVTTFQRLLDTIGPQDAEQVIHGQLRFGLDHPDYLGLRAPRPTLVSATSGDYFDAVGSWEAVREAKRLFTRLGAPERIDIVEADGRHGVQPANLAAIVQWMRRWLLGRDEPVTLPAFDDFPTLPEAELRCTPRGQVLLLPDEASVFDLNAAVAADHAAARPAWATRPREALVARVSEVAGCTPAASLPRLTAEAVGTARLEATRTESFVLRGGTGGPLPAVVFHPERPSGGACLIVRDGGKAVAAAAGGPVEAALARGLIAVAIDLRGQGETAHGRPDPLLGDWRTFSLAYLLGHAVAGAHADDIRAVADWAAATYASAGHALTLDASGVTGVAALHAAALAPERFAALILSDMPRSWTAIAGSPEGGRWFTATIHGVLAHYDLPDLVAAIGDSRITWVD